ncbi:MAG: hypothetical protein LC798_21840 [Chloroflexi bacterium]|nr:hypothetical protein [Chloroflexota bacterium]
MDIPPLTYLSVDSVSQGVGLSQVVRYVERVANRGVDVTLHSFEQGAPSADVAARLSAAGVRWRPHRFRVSGAGGGVLRVAHGGALIARAGLVHARSDMAAASALVTRRPAWVWDLRGFWREQRMALGLISPGSRPERVMRQVEAASAKSCTGIVTLTRAAIDVLRERFGDDVADKARVITTCVDLDLFSQSPLPERPPVRLLLAGTLNGLYDVPTMFRLVGRLRARCATELTVLSPEPTPWDSEFLHQGVRPRRALPTAMPEEIRSSHAGLSVLRDVGVSNRAATPTKLGEFLASGRPVIVNAGVGDMDELPPAHDCGVVLHDRSDDAVDEAADDLLRLLTDPETPSRCRALAAEHFDVERGVDQLLAVYRDAVR